MLKRFALLSIILVLLLGTSLQLFPHPPQRQKISKWLTLGPIPVPPADKKLLKNSSGLLEFRHLPIANIQPVKGAATAWAGGKPFTWRTPNGYAFPSNGTQLVYLATYLETNRWLKTRLVINKGDFKATGFLNGEPVKISASEDGKTLEAELKLTNEKHLLVLKVLLPEGKSAGIEAFLENKEPFQKATIAVSTSPEHKMNITNVLNSVRLINISVSPNGRRAAVQLVQTRPPEGRSERWVEIVDVNSRATLFSSRHFGSMSRVHWLKNSRHFTYTQRKKGKTAIYKYDSVRHGQELLLEGIENFTNYWWAPDNSYLIYSVSHPKKDKDYIYIKDLPERSAFPESRRSLYIFYPSAAGGGGVTHLVSDQTLDFRTAVISPDSRRVLLVREEIDYSKRPFSTKTVHLFDVAGHSHEQLLQDAWIDSLTWAPDSQKILVKGGPSSFDGVGNTLKSGTIPNDFDYQAFIYYIKLKRAEAISKKFDPAIDRVYWTTKDTIYFLVENKSFKRLYKYSVSKKTYRLVKPGPGMDVIRRIDIPRGKHLAVGWTGGVNHPFRLYRFNLSSNRVSLLKDYNAGMYRNVKFGKYTNFNYTAASGRIVMGRLYYPTNFDSTRKYPMIVYYYGGTSPVSRDFSGRYPKEWYAANGYAVYVLQPTGATGFGQEAAAVHVNDWGAVTSKEIIGAVKKLTGTYSFIDRKRIGAMGASYGGFLTQYLATQTDVFAAYISHAGITALSSYWGSGDWGYSYSALATADSFPWNRKDIYVGQSPLFLAERIKQPLLLLHGASDNNVPPGESYQMFAALKLLGKEAALITYSGEQHFIMEYKKRIHWMRAIIAWWDKHLKDQPEHWDQEFAK